MSRPAQLPLPGFDRARAEWRDAYAAQMGGEPVRRNRSGVAVEPLYTPEHWGPERYMDDLGFPAAGPMTRGIYPSMHRGRAWSQRQLIGLGTPADYNARLKAILASGANAVSLIPCNSVYRGYDADQVDARVTRIDQGMETAEITDTDHSDGKTLRQGAFLVTRDRGETSTVGSATVSRPCRRRRRGRPLPRDRLGPGGRRRRPRRRRRCRRPG